jgi:hypothetical protein
MNPNEAQALDAEMAANGVQSSRYAGASMGVTPKSMLYLAGGVLVLGLAGLGLKNLSGGGRYSDSDSNWLARDRHRERPSGRGGYAMASRGGGYDDDPIPLQERGIMVPVRGGGGRRDRDLRDEDEAQYYGGGGGGGGRGGGRSGRGRDNRSFY